MKISVIISSFNADKFLSKAIESFLLQNYDNKELLIIDDISTDKSHEVIAGYQKKFPQFIKWIKEKDSGISNSRNIALKYAMGDLIGFLGADDFFDKNFFAEMSYYIRQNPDFDVIYFNNYAIGISNSFNAGAAIRFTRKNLIKFCPIASGESFYYRREIFSCLQFNEKNRYSMDYELNMALVSTNKKNGEKYSFYPVNITAVFNFCSGKNISSLNKLQQRLETIVVQLKYSSSIVEKFRIFWRQKKLILRNFLQFRQFYKVLICGSKNLKETLKKHSF
jgi:glycosyltransferase involved in cell wall biosynthesis